MKLMKTLVACLAFAGLAAPALADQHGGGTVNTAADVLVDLVGDCSNSGGSYIKLNSLGLALHDSNLTVLLDGGGSHDGTTSATGTISLPLQGLSPLPKQGNVGVTGNPNIAVYFYRQLGDTQPLLIAGPVRCNKLGSVKKQIPVVLPAGLSFDLAGDCTNQGSKIDISQLALTLKDAIFSVVVDGGGDHDYQTGPISTDNFVIPLSSLDQSTFPKQGSLQDGVTGNPNISVYYDHYDQLHPTEGLLAGPTRCNKI